MNNKHLSVLILLLCILGSLALSQKLNTQLTEAEQQKQQAEFALSQERASYQIKSISVATMEQDSAAIREYLATWMPKLKETDDESKARNAFGRIMKQAGQGLISKKNTGKLEEIKENTFIGKRFQSVVAMEGDYVTAMTFLAQLEKQMPASRISSYTISKGTRGDDVKFNFTIDTPVLNLAVVETAAASGVVTPGLNKP